MRVSTSSEVVGVTRWALGVLVLSVGLVGCSSDTASPHGSDPDACETNDDCLDGLCVEGTCAPLADVSDGGLDDDVLSTDSRVPDVTTDATDVHDGGLGAECTSDDDCDSGVCLRGVDGRFCSESCDGECPEGYECRLFAGGGADFALFCIPVSPILCVPCESDLDCGAREDLCLERLDGQFCGLVCDPTDEEPCPSGFSCQLVVRTGDGGEPEEFTQCIPDLDICGDCLDLDRDGYGVGPGCIDEDCDDSDPFIHPGMPSICDGRDTNCSGVIDEGYDLTRDLANCGECGNVCTVAGGTPICVDGGCEIDACDAGRDSCDGLYETGCEISIGTDSSNCGECGNVCDLESADAICVEGGCAISRCLGTRENCDGEVETGCETDVSTSIPHCGGCGVTCAPPNAIPRCLGGECEIQQCESGFRNCNDEQTDGCEVNIREDDDNCGACGTVCDGGRTCLEGFCRCDGDLIFFGGVCQAGELPAVDTLAADEITTSGARMNGAVVEPGVPSLTRHGFCWSPGTFWDDDVEGADCVWFGAAPAPLDFSHRLTEQAPGSTWTYVSVGEVEGGESVRGPERSFTLLQAPAVATDAVGTVTTTTAELNGELLVVGVPAVASDDWGFCWGTMAAPSLSNNLSCARLDRAGEAGVFSATAEGLTPGVSFNVRAFALNSVATVYGEPVSFTTLRAPEVQTLAATGVTTSQAVLNGRLSVVGVPAATEFGFCVGGSPNITPGSFGVNCAPVTELADGGAFSFLLDSGLQPGQTYWFLAYAINPAGTATGEARSFIVLQEPRVDTRSVIDITATGGLLRGELRTVGVPNPTQHGFCVSTGAGFPPDEEDCSVRMGAISSSGFFQRAVSNLESGEEYYVWAFAENASGRAYGDRVSFNTLSLPIVQTDNAAGTGQTTATLNGTMTRVGIPFPTQHGFCIGAMAEPSRTNGALCPDLGPRAAEGPFSANVTGLTAGTTYNARAFATNSVGTSYGSAVNFRTWELATVSTSGATGVTTSGATLNGSVTATGNPSIVQHGFCWGPSPAGLAPGLALCSELGARGGVGDFSGVLTGLTPGATYHFRAYAQNDAGLAYGQTLSFTTPRVPAVRTVAPTGVGTTVATLNGALDDLGVPVASDHGFCFGTTPDPSVGTDTCINRGAPSSIGSFSSVAGSLETGTQYHVRAFAQHSTGIVYGSSIAFQTLRDPVVQTGLPVVQSETSVQLNGTVVEPGVPVGEQRGFCRGPSINPALNGPGVFCDGVAGAVSAGPFSALHTGLTPGATYYVRAWIRRGSTYTYGESRSFQMLQQSVVQTRDVTNRQPTSVTLRGEVLAVGVPAPTNHGLCWGTSANPSVGGTCHAYGTAPSVGLFSRSVTGLAADTQYHVRAWITVGGTPQYGDNVPFQTCSLTEVPGPNLNDDRNCDGVPGVDINRTIFVRSGGSTASDCGLTPSTPCGTLALGFSRAASLAARDHVAVATGAYSGPELSLPSNVTVVGGYSSNFSSRSNTRAVYTSSGNTALRVGSLAQPSRIDRVDFNTNNRPLNNPSIAVIVDGAGTGFTLTNSSITAGNGGGGSSGSNGASNTTTASPGSPGSGQTGGDGAGAGSGSGGRGGDGGGRGDRGQFGFEGNRTGAQSCTFLYAGRTTRNVPGSTGGDRGESGRGCNDGDPERGYRGVDGCQGLSGNNGGGGQNLGEFGASLVYTASGGSNGSAGQRGGGGGGGGGGAGEGCIGFRDRGRGGGGGGQGGVGGGGGFAGAGGQPSVGMLVRNSTVATTNVTIASGAGGAGGSGGAGGTGGNGGQGGAGVPNANRNQGAGGDGGNGGRGGTGGCGGGGGGGPSIALWGVGTAIINASGTFTTTAGLGGAGGTSCGSAGATGLSAARRTVTVNATIGPVAD